LGDILLSNEGLWSTYPLSAIIGAWSLLGTWKWWNINFLHPRGDLIEVSCRRLIAGKYRRYPMYIVYKPYMNDA
jgi:hypothetical protein